MIIMIKTKPNTNGNIYGVKVDTERKTYEVGYGMSEYADFRATKKQINDFITYNLKQSGFRPVIKL